MIEEPYRWVEAIANRREYIEHQLSTGSPIVALSYADGVLLFTLSRERQKVFEIYDRIAMGGIGHPGDIERLRMVAIELCSTEGFARSAYDVSLRRLANYSLSPALKSAFEQIYGAPYLARLLFAELGRGTTPDSYLRLDYDGSIRTNGGGFGRSFEQFGVISGTKISAERMEAFLRDHDGRNRHFPAALRTAAEAWSLGHMTLAAEESDEVPSRTSMHAHLNEQLPGAAVECAVLDRNSTLPVTWRSVSEEETRALLGAE